MGITKVLAKYWVISARHLTSRQSSSNLAFDWQEKVNPYQCPTGVSFCPSAWRGGRTNEKISLRPRIHITRWYSDTSKRKQSGWTSRRSILLTHTTILLLRSKHDESFYTLPWANAMFAFLAVLRIMLLIDRSNENAWLTSNILHFARDTP